MKTSEHHVLNRRDIVRVILFSIMCGFASSFAWSMHICFRSTDPYGLSPFSVDSLVTDLLIGIICGIPVAIVAIGLALLAFRYSLVTGLTDRRLLIAIVIVYAIATSYLCIIYPSRIGVCRLD